MSVLETTATKAAAPPPVTADAAELLRFLVAKSQQVAAVSGDFTAQGTPNDDLGQKLTDLLSLTHGKDVADSVFNESEEGDEIDKASEILSDTDDAEVAPAVIGLSTETRNQRQQLADVFRSGRCSAAEYVRMSAEYPRDRQLFIDSRKAVAANTFDDAQRAADRAAQKAAQDQMRRFRGR